MWITYIFASKKSCKNCGKCRFFAATPQFFAGKFVFLEICDISAFLFLECRAKKYLHFAFCVMQKFFHRHLYLQITPRPKFIQEKFFKKVFHIFTPARIKNSCKKAPYTFLCDALNCKHLLLKYQKFQSHQER